MSDVSESPLAGKPAEMSFSDWKKMKSALNSSTENKASSSSEKAKSKKVTNSTKAANNYNNGRQYNSSNINNNSNYSFRQNNSPFLDSLKQNNFRLFNNNSDMCGFMGNQMLMMQALNAARNTVSAFNNNVGPFSNNICPFNNDVGPFNNNRMLFNNMSQMNSSMNSFNHNRSSFNNNMNTFRNNTIPFNSNNSIAPSGAPRSFGPNWRNQQNNRGFTDNYIGKNNDFICMSDVPIPQQPFKQNKNIPSLMSIRTQKRGINANRAKPVNKTNEPKPVETIAKASESKEANNQTASKSNTGATTPAVSQKKPRPLKQKIPVKPPSILALTPEAHAAKQRMWREYRQQIKPFKNKDFLNAKRVIQRLKKKPYEELDEKEKERWEKANEFVNSHKKMLTEKAIARGEAASARAARIQDTMSSGNNYTQSTMSVEMPSTSNNLICSTNNDNSCARDKTSKDMPTSNGTADAIAVSENWELWSSFVPGGVLFKS